MYKVVITGSNLPHKNEEKAALQDIANVLIENVETEEELIRLTHDADAILTDTAKISKKVINSAEKLKVIVEYGIGVDNIDLKAAAAKGIYVCNVPDVYIREVAEHAIALMFSVARNVPRANTQVKDKLSWDFNNLDAIKLCGKILGIIGCGKIGRTVASMANCLGLNVVAYDPYISKKDLKDINVNLLSFNDLLKTADIISIHVPHNSNTHHLIGNKELNTMKKNAILINVSRGGIIDELALIEALKMGKLYGVGLDVLEDEPYLEDNLLLKYENVIVTPHMAWKSELAAKNLEMAAIEEVRRVLTGKKPINIVNF